MKGKITWPVWTIMGTVEVQISYEIEMIGNNMATAHFKAHADVPSTPELYKAIDEAQEEITMACMEDAKKREKKQEKKAADPVRPEDYPRVLPGSKWGAN